MHLLMNGVIKLEVDCLVLLKLLDEVLAVLLDGDLYLVLVEVGCRVGPSDFLDDIVVRHVDVGTEESKGSDEAFGLYLFVVVEEEEVHEALSDLELELFVVAPRPVDQLYLFAQVFNFPVAVLDSIDALLELLMDDEVCKPPDR